MPAETGTALVFDQEVVLSSGIAGQEIPAIQPAKPLVGGAAVSAKKHAHSNFPNQECGKDECIPAAVSNSLKFLNKKHNMGLNDNDLSTAKMKDATNWGTKKIGGVIVGTGGWIDHNNARPAGERNAWWEDKKAYMEKNNIPVTTRKITDLSKLAAEIDAGQDVELMGDWHCAAIVGITDLGGGKYKIDVAHDKQQGVTPGGLTTEPITYDPVTKKFKGSPGWFDGSSFRYAIVECPKLPSWTFHFWYYDCPGGWLEIYGTHNCERFYPPIFDDYIISCKEYTGYIPDKIDGYTVNDIIFDFYWDYWCNNEDHIKFVNSDWNPYTEQWELNPIGDALDEYVTDDLTVPLIGDPYGEIQDVYVVMDISEFAADPRPPQDEYYISYGECDDLPGYLIGTTPITFNPDASPDENPFSTNLLTGVLYHDGEVTCSPKAEPPVVPTIDGATNGKAGNEYDYTFVTTDPNEDEVYYYIEWGDGNIEEWIGPYDSDEEVTLSYSWDEKGTYITRVKAKDTDDLQSDWATLEVSMPKNKPYINTPLLNFLQNHPHLFPLLRQLLEL